MRFITITLIAHAPDPVTGAQVSTAERSREVAGSALLGEELGFDRCGVGERHERPFIWSPTVVLFHVNPEDQWDRNAGPYEVSRRLWAGNKITYGTRFRPPLTDAEVWPRPLQRPARIWHGSATSKEPVDTTGMTRPRSRPARPSQLRAVPARHRPGTAPRDPGPALGLGRRSARRRRRPRGRLPGRHYWLRGSP